MKNIIIILSAAIVSIAIFAGCTKSGNSTLPDASMTAITRGIHSFAVAGPELGSSLNTGNLTITGSDTINHRTIILTIDNYSGIKGNYPIKSNNVAAVYDSSATSVETAANGNIYLTAVFPQLIGTFYFTCTDSTKVMSGTFVVLAP